MSDERCWQPARLRHPREWCPFYEIPIEEIDKYIGMILHVKMTTPLERADCGCRILVIHPDDDVPGDQRLIPECQVSTD